MVSKPWVSVGVKGVPVVSRGLRSFPVDFRGVPGIFKSFQ